MLRIVLHIICKMLEIIMMLIQLLNESDVLNIKRQTLIFKIFTVYNERMFSSLGCLKRIF